MPRLRSSPVRRSNSKVSNRSTRAAKTGVDIPTSGGLHQSLPQFLPGETWSARAGRLLFFSRLAMEKNLRADWGGKDCRLLGPSLECALTCCSAVRREHKVRPLEVRGKKA